MSSEFKSNDPLTNAVHFGIKRGIRVAMENKCLSAAIILTYSGMDAMAFLSMPAGQRSVRKRDFVAWAERYIRFPCNEQLTALDLYGARCAMLHNYGAESDLSRDGKCRQVAYMDRGVPEVRFKREVSEDLVIVSVDALVNAFFGGVDRFLVDVFSDAEAARGAEARLDKLMCLVSVGGD